MASATTMLNLPVATSLVGDEYTWIVQAGTDKRVTTTSLSGAALSTLIDFATRTAAAAAIIPVLTSYVRTAGYSTIGDGGASLYKRAVAATLLPGFQSADGAWWEFHSVFPNIVQFGAVGDGTTISDAAFTAMAASSLVEFYVPEGRYITTINTGGNFRVRPATSVLGDKRFWGPGTIVTDYGIDTSPAGQPLQRGRYLHVWEHGIPAANVADTYVAGPGGWFNGDFSHVILPIEVLLHGPIIDSPANTYYQPFNSSTIAIAVEASEGSLQENNSGLFSTYIVENLSLRHDAGGGGLSAMFLSGHITRAYSGFNDQNPTGTATLGLLGGQLYTSVPGVFIDAVEIEVTDNGNDISVVGFLLDTHRTAASAPGSKTFWKGFWIQTGAADQPIDYAFGLEGNAYYGLDLSRGVFPGEAGAILISAGSRIYFNADGNGAVGSRAGFYALYCDGSTLRMEVNATEPFVVATTGIIVSPATASISTGSGSGIFGGGIGVAGAVYAGGQIASVVTPTTSPVFDTSGVATVPIVTGAGSHAAITPADGTQNYLITICETNAIPGGPGAIYRCINTITTLISQNNNGFVASTAAPGVGEMSVAWLTNAYHCYNNSGTNGTFRVIATKIAP